MARPTKYNSKYHPKLVKYVAMLGKTEDEIAKELEVSKATITNWKQSHPEFLAALKAGKKVPDDKVQNALFQRAIGYEYIEETQTEDNAGNIISSTKFQKHQPGNVTAQIFWLKNRRPEQWRDKREFEGEVYVLKAPEITKPDETGRSEA